MLYKVLLFLLVLYLVEFLCRRRFVIRVVIVSSVCVRRNTRWLVLCILYYLLVIFV